MRIEEVLDRTAAFLHEKKCTKVMLSDTNLLLKLGAAEHFAGGRTDRQAVVGNDRR